MRVLVVGGSGFIGRQIVQACSEAGHDVVVSTRGTDRPRGLPDGVGTLTWDTQQPVPTSAHFDAVVNEAGASIVGRRWTSGYKRQMQESRITTNRRLAQWIKAHEEPPSVFISANAVGYYGYKPEGPVDESAPAGDDFLARMCRDWEDAAMAASGATRVVSMRQGIVLSTEHGALGIMLPFFRAGVGGPVGSGKQPFPWITPRDLVRFVMRALEDATISGAYNVVAPERVTNGQFTDVLGDVLHRPTVLPVPPFALKALWGEGAQAVSSGQEAVPRRLEEAGFSWEEPHLGPALAGLIGAGRKG